jgi:hypothetical protein
MEAIVQQFQNRERAHESDTEQECDRLCHARSPNSVADLVRDATLRQDELFRQADARWERNHGPIPGGAVVLLFVCGAGDIARGTELQAVVSDGA